MKAIRIKRPKHYMCTDFELDLDLYDTFKCEHCLDDFCKGCFELKKTNEGKFCQGCYEDYKEGHDEDYVV